MLKLASQLVIAVLFVSLVGCSSARIVAVQPGEGGEIAIAPRDSTDARAKAEVLMRENCRAKNFKVTEEGEAVTGSTTQTRGQANLSKKSPTMYTSGTATTTNTTEWRLKYKCE